ncbi:histidine kinase dimerization/phospho-acceptor domain-containing protein, partial [Actinotignum timonense]|uniref:histidine kinase dimerization/phospho-acceptor domain-containing protein n=1 Tax=Actinotignum timonense TaxID=1870995 RepID=UPI002A839089
ELRTPLATVRGYAELYRLGGVPEDRVMDAMGRVESEANRMSGLVEYLLQLARIDEGRPLEWQRIDLTQICKNALMDFHARSDKRP